MHFECDVWKERNIGFFFARVIPFSIHFPWFMKWLSSTANKSQRNLNGTKFASGNWLGACGGEEMTTNCTYSAQQKCLVLITKSKGLQNTNTHIYIYIHVCVCTNSGVLHGYPPGIITLLCTENVKMARGEKDVCAFCYTGLCDGFLLCSLNLERFFIFHTNPVL